MIHISYIIYLYSIYFKYTLIYLINRSNKCNVLQNDIIKCTAHFKLYTGKLK